MQLANRPRNQYLPVVGGAAAGLAFASNTYRNLYKAYNFMRQNYRSGRTRPRFSKNVMVSRVNQRAARAKALSSKRASRSRKGGSYAGTNVDSQYVGKFKGGALRTKKRDVYSERGFRYNVETKGIVNSKSADGPVRFVAQAVNPPAILYAIAVAFWRNVMAKQYNKLYSVETEIFQLNTVANYEKPYQIVFAGWSRDSQTTGTNVTQTYTPGSTSTLADAATWLVTNVFTNPSFGWRNTQHRILSGVDVYDRVNAVVCYNKRIDIDKLMLVQFWSKLSCRIQNVTRADNPEGTGGIDYNTQSVWVRPLHGNVIYSKGHCPRHKIDNNPLIPPIPWTYEDVANGVIIPKSDVAADWAKTIQPPSGMQNVEKAYNIQIGAGQIKDFCLYYKKSMYLSNFLTLFHYDAESNSTAGQDAFGRHGLNRNALVQLEKFVDVQVGVAQDLAEVAYHCEWEMGAMVTGRRRAYMPTGYRTYTEGS